MNYNFHVKKVRVNVCSENGWASIEFAQNNFVPLVRFSASLPWIKWRHRTANFGDVFLTWAIEANTNVAFTKEEASGFWSFTVQVLGFGFNVTRQLSY